MIMIFQIHLILPYFFILLTTIFIYFNVFAINKRRSYNLQRNKILKLAPVILFLKPTESQHTQSTLFGSPLSILATLNHNEGYWRSVSLVACLP